MTEKLSDKLREIGNTVSKMYSSSDGREIQEIAYKFKLLEAERDKLLPDSENWHEFLKYLEKQGVIRFKVNLMRTPKEYVEAIKTALIVLEENIQKLDEAEKQVKYYENLKVSGKPKNMGEHIIILQDRIDESEKWVDVWISRSEKEKTKFTPVSSVNFPYLKGILQGKYSHARSPPSESNISKESES